MTFGVWLIIQTTLAWAAIGAAWIIGGSTATLTVSPMLFAVFEITRKHVYCEETIRPRTPASDSSPETSEKTATRLALGSREVYAAAMQRAEQTESEERLRREMWFSRVGAAIPAARWALLGAIIVPMGLTLFDASLKSNPSLWATIALVVILASGLLVSAKQCRSCIALLPNGLATPFWFLIYRPMAMNQDDQ